MESAVQVEANPEKQFRTKFAFYKTKINKKYHIAKVISNVCDSSHCLQDINISKF